MKNKYIAFYKLAFVFLTIGSANAWIPPSKQGLVRDHFVINQGNDSLAFLDPNTIVYTVSSSSESEGPCSIYGTTCLRSYDLITGANRLFFQFSSRTKEENRYKFLNVFNGEIFRSSLRNPFTNDPGGFVSLDHFKNGNWTSYSNRKDGLPPDGVKGVFRDNSNRTWLSTFEWDISSHGGSASTKTNGLMQLENKREYFPPNCPTGRNNDYFIGKMVVDEFDPDPWFVGSNGEDYSGNNNGCYWLMHYNSSQDYFVGYSMKDPGKGVPTGYQVAGSGVASESKIWFILDSKLDSKGNSSGFIAFNKLDKRFEEPILGDSDTIGVISQITLDLNGLPVVYNMDGVSVRVDLNNQIVYNKILTPKTTPPPNNWHPNSYSVSTGADGSLWYFYGENYFGNQSWNSPGNELRIFRETPAGILIEYPSIFEQPTDIAWNTNGDFAIRFLKRGILFYDSVSEQFRDIPVAQ